MPGVRCFLDCYQNMIKSLTNIYLIIVIALVWLAISVLLSITYHDWLWLARSGSILTLCGAALATRRLVRLGVSGFVKDESTIDGGFFEGGEVSAEAKVAEREQMLDVRAASIGFWFIIIGTLIWGYGDLMNRI
jgi:hypothetical protein